MKKNTKSIGNPKPQTINTSHKATNKRTIVELNEEDIDKNKKIKKKLNLHRSDYDIMDDSIYDDNTLTNGNKISTL